MTRLQWIVHPAILMPNEEHHPEVLRDGLMREMSFETWQELEREAARARWDEKHPRCAECGQFLKKRPPPEPGDYDLFRSEWIGHHYRDYWGEWEHV